MSRSCAISLAVGLSVNSRVTIVFHSRPNCDDYFVLIRVCHAVTLSRSVGGTVGSVPSCTGPASEHGGRIDDIRRTAGS
jgi:hypothetical protein